MNELQTTILITKVLHENGCTYNKLKDLLFEIEQHYRELREQLEYDTSKDFFYGIKSRDVGNQVVSEIRYET